MTSAANKRSVMTLFSNNDDIYCHQVRFVLAEKGATYETENVVSGTINEHLMDVNPAGSVPTLMDRDLSINTPHIILEYLDERFPHPPLMPVFPVERAQKRQLMHDIQETWFHNLKVAEFGKSDAERNKAKKYLKEQILAISAGFTPYFMSEEFSLVDCYMAPLLWKMQNLGIEFTGAGSKAVKAYMDLVFKRDSFQESINSDAPRNFMEEK